MSGQRNRDIGVKNKGVGVKEWGVGVLVPRFRVWFVLLCQDSSPSSE